MLQLQFRGICTAYIGFEHFQTGHVGGWLGRMRAWTKKVSGEAHESYFELQGTILIILEFGVWSAGKRQKVHHSWICLKLILQLVEHLCCVRNSPEDKNNDYDDNGGDDDDIENEDDLDDNYDGDLSAQGTSCEWPDSQLIHELPSIDLPSLRNWTEIMMMVMAF